MPPRARRERPRRRRTWPSARAGAGSNMAASCTSGPRAARFPPQFTFVRTGRRPPRACVTTLVLCRRGLDRDGETGRRLGTFAFFASDTSRASSVRRSVTSSRLERDDGVGRRLRHAHGLARDAGFVHASCRDVPVSPPSAPGSSTVPAGTAAPRHGSGAAWGARADACRSLVGQPGFTADWSEGVTAPAPAGADGGRLSARDGRGAARENETGDG